MIIWPVCPSAAAADRTVTTDDAVACALDIGPDSSAQPDRKSEYQE
jgi:hypothetical protein